MAKHTFRRPTPQQIGNLFKQKTHCDPPPASKIYTCDTLSPVNAVAEFAPMGGVLIAYPGTVAHLSPHEQLAPGGARAFGIPDELIIRMQQADSQEPVHIFILCADADQQGPITANLSATAEALKLPFDARLLHLVPWDTDTYWTRDYGPWWIQNKQTGYFGIAKHSYTTLGGGSVGLVEGAENVSPLEGLGIFRPNDDYAAVKFSDYLNAPIRQWNSASWQNHAWNGQKWVKDIKKLPKIEVHDWFFTGLLDVGGNYMVTGDGTIASSYLVATQNELPVHKEKRTTDPCAATLDSRMNYITEQLNRFMGIHTYHVLTDPSGTYIGHIDCWGKFLAPRKILIAESEDPKINEAYSAIAATFESNGFDVYRALCQRMYIPGSDPSTAATTAAYTNSLILNDHVYVPIAGEAYKEHDDAALAVYREALPGYTVVGIPGKPEFPWLGTDAMHCRTRGVPRQVVNNWLRSQNLL